MIGAKNFYLRTPKHFGLLEMNPPPSNPHLGVCYYPEHWPEQQWAADAKKMVEVGLSWVRIAEFSWSRIEPSEGTFDWDWLDRAIEVLGKAGLKVVLSTPTATPPRWMITKYPEMLAYDKHDRPRKFGSRRHYCFSHKGYRTECSRIADQMGQRYGANPHIHAWQIDNEYGCHDTSVSYSPHAEQAFRHWLLEKYKTIDELNSAWGNVFWSMEYKSFGEINLPNLTVTEPNPSHVMDFRRFSSNQIVAFNAAQVSALRLYTDVPLIHNYMGRITDFDHFDVGKDLDIASWDSYPLGFLLDRSNQPQDFQTKFARQGDPDFQAFHHDLYRAVGNGRWWVMEQQPGPVNWAPFNPAPLQGMVRLWTWEAVAHGAEVVSYFRWRQAPFAQEQMHSGLLRPDNKEAPVFEEVSKAAKELETLNWQKPNEADVAIVFDYPSNWAWDIQPQGQSFNYFKLVYDFYCALRRAGQSVDILPSNTSDFGDRKLVIIPGLFAWNKELKRAMKTFKGEIIVGPRSGSKTDAFQIPSSLPPEIDNMDIKVASVETLDPTLNVPIENGSAFHSWREYVETTETVSMQTQDGHPALITKGNISYLCGWPDKELFDRLLDNTTLEISQMPEGLRVRDFGDYRLYTNYNDHAVRISAHELPAASVRLINKNTNSTMIEN